MQTSANHRKVLIIGASSEIGTKLCEIYLAKEHSVIGHFAHHPKLLEPLAKEYSQLSLLQSDLTDLDAVADLAKRHSSVDVVIFLASMMQPSSLVQTDVGLLLQTLKVGALANFVIMSQIGPMMVEKGWGRFVIGSSIGVKFNGGTDSFAYALANHTSEFIPREVRDWSADGVLTNVIRVGLTETAAHSRFPDRDLNNRTSKVPMKRMATPREIADFIFWHGSDLNSFVTGQTIAISGGE